MYPLGYGGDDGDGDGGGVPLWHRCQEVVKWLLHKSQKKRKIE